MADNSSTDLTESLIAHADGDSRAADRLMTAVYSELRRIAAKLMQNERPGHTLQPTAVVNEAYLRLIDIERVNWKSKAHFCNMAAKIVRRVLVDSARQRGAEKRGGEFQRVTLEDDLVIDPESSMELLALDQALIRLAKRHEREARVAEMRIFSGMEIKEIAETLGVSERTVSNDWQYARARLVKELSPSGKSTE